MNRGKIWGLAIEKLPNVEVPNVARFWIWKMIGEKFETYQSAQCREVPNLRGQTVQGVRSLVIFQLSLDGWNLVPSELSFHYSIGRDGLNTSKAGHSQRKWRSSSSFAHRGQVLLRLIKCSSGSLYDIHPCKHSGLPAGFLYISHSVFETELCLMDCPLGKWLAKVLGVDFATASFIAGSTWLDPFDDVIDIYSWYNLINDY